MRTTIVILLILFAGLQYRLWFSNDGLLKTWHLKHEINNLQIKNETAIKHNLNLASETGALKKGENAIENRARSDLGMVKKGEVFYQVVK